jgi:hypothetical protein
MKSFISEQPPLSEETLSEEEIVEIVVHETTSDHAVATAELIQSPTPRELATPVTESIHDPPRIGPVTTTDPTVQPLASEVSTSDIPQAPALDESLAVPIERISYEPGMFSSEGTMDQDQVTQAPQQAAGTDEIVSSSVPEKTISETISKVFWIPRENSFLNSFTPIAIKQAGGLEPQTQTEVPEDPPQEPQRQINIPEVLEQDPPIPVDMHVKSQEKLETKVRHAPQGEPEMLKEQARTTSMSPLRQLNKRREIFSNPEINFWARVRHERTLIDEMIQMINDANALTKAPLEVCVGKYGILNEYLFQQQRKILTEKRIEESNPAHVGVTVDIEALKNPRRLGTMLTSVLRIQRYYRKFSARRKQRLEDLKNLAVTESSDARNKLRQRRLDRHLPTLSAVQRPPPTVVEEGSSPPLNN